jgi:hypothetical protein
MDKRRIVDKVGKERKKKREREREGECEITKKNERKDLSFLAHFFHFATIERIENVPKRIAIRRRTTCID